jgi:hypothetical protein
MSTTRGRNDLAEFQPGFDIVLGADLIYSPKVRLVVVAQVIYGKQQQQQQQPGCEF